MKKILITGASSGIGLSCAKKLCNDHKLILCARNIEALEKIRSALNEENITIYKTDVTDQTQVNELFENIKTADLVPDTVINAAGLALGLETLEKNNVRDWEQMIDTNIKGLLMISRLALKNMKEKNRGHLIHIGSIAGIDSYPNGIVYAATKAAVRSISDGLRKEVVAHKIKITNIQPGMAETNFSNVRFGGDTEKAKRVYEGHQATHRR